MADALTIDFETYSEAGYVLDVPARKVRPLVSRKEGGLPLVGTPVYAEHPSTDLLCMGYSLPGCDDVRLWVPGEPPPADALAHVEAGGLVEAWNATFEFYIWNMVACRRYGWPALPLAQIRCDMAKARRFGMPGSLDKAAGVLGTPGKDKDGVALLRRLSRPHSQTKKRTAWRRTPATDWDDFAKLYRYCQQDVLAEKAAARAIPELTPDELATWQHDQAINLRGVQVDVAALSNAIEVLDQAERKYTVELARITGGAVSTASEVEKMRAWVAQNGGPDLPNLQDATVTAAIEHTGGAARRVLQIRQQLSSANVKKLRTLALQVSSDGRLRDQYTYCGAAQTGRASAGGVQLQNITAKGPKVCVCDSCGKHFGRDVADVFCPRCASPSYREAPEWTVDAVEDAVGDLAARSVEEIERVWGDPITLLCGCLRGLFIARDGHDLVCVDYSAIEAVVAACVSRCQWRIDVFSTHGKIYEASAAKATGIPFEEIIAYKAQHGRHHPARATIGKVRELAGGYGGWVGAWKNFGADAFMTDDEIKTDVLKWRAESPEIVEMWGGQFRHVGPGRWDFAPELHGLEGCVIQAITQPGRWFHHIDIGYIYQNDILYCRLPSGRFLYYHRPRLTPGVDKLDRGPCFDITFEGYNTNPQKGPRGWVRMETYGGRLFENVVQAIAADLQFLGLRRVEAAGYPIVMHTHDEGTAEVAHGTGSVDHMAAIMAERPAWASWWPIRAAGWRHRRYQKD